jgi:transcriptional regulator NrdR family protein
MSKLKYMNEVAFRRYANIFTDHSSMNHMKTLNK